MVVSHGPDDRCCRVWSVVSLMMNVLGLAGDACCCDDTMATPSSSPTHVGAGEGATRGI